MRLVGCLLVLVACRAQPAATASTPAAICAPCPACPTATCPEQTCPSCPEPPQPVAQDWYCYDLHRAKMPVSGYCRTSAQACETLRQESITRKYGKADPCVPERTAFCFTLSDPVTLTQQRGCARTAENCESRRQSAVDDPLAKTYNIGPCAPTLNTNPLPFPSPSDREPPAESNP